MLAKLQTSVQIFSIIFFCLKSPVVCQNRVVRSAVKTPTHNLLCTQYTVQNLLRVNYCPQAGSLPDSYKTSWNLPKHVRKKRKIICYHCLCHV